MATRFYETPDSKRYPLTEARHDMAFRVYRSDRRKAKKGDPHNCLVALGIKRDRDVIDVFIGSGGDAYVIFKGRAGEEDYAVHFTISRPARKLIDMFDKDRRSATQQVILRKPTDGRTLEARSRLDKDRRRRIKAGTHSVKARATPRSSRVVRLGVGSRPRPRISKSGSVSEVQPAMI
jgi:hypothetical protein